MAIDANSRVWQNIADHINAEIQATQKSLEVKGLDTAATEFERGRIKALRDILDLAAPSDATPAFDPLII
ncbi:MAG: hypothetical protein M9944_12970 [Rhizobiaceae bacterium]|nr:hypothetical protein [Rhizobiaceae bacterium]